MIENQDLKIDEKNRLFCACPVCGVRADVYPDQTGDGAILQCEDNPGHDKRAQIDGISIFLIV